MLVVDEDRLQGLLRDPRESLAVEHKAWIDPSSPDGIAKIARAIIALRNNNGGYLVVGMSNNGTPDGNIPNDIEKLYHQDVVQAIAAKYSSDLFEVQVYHVALSGAPFVVVAVPEGVRSPAAAKRDLLDAGSRLIRENAVYVRTLNANNTVSTAEPRHSDWPRLIEICHDNREADIARFLRRHLAGAQLGALLEAIAGQTPAKQPDARTELMDVQRDGLAHYLAASANSGLPDFGFAEVSLIVKDAGGSAWRPNQDFLNRIFALQPRHTGWPAWIDSRGFRGIDGRPNVIDGGWQAFVNSTDGFFSAHVDFWRIVPSELKFYLLRGLEDDLNAEKVTPFTKLDVELPIWRLVEALAVGQAFGSGLVDTPDASKLTFMFRWSRLKNRELSSWANSRRWWGHSVQKCLQDEVVSFVTLAADAPRAALIDVAHEALAPLYEAFGGYSFPRSAIESVANDLFKQVR